MRALGLQTWQLLDVEEEDESVDYRLRSCGGYSLGFRFRV